jgi:hypothetical protein
VVAKGFRGLPDGYADRLLGCLREELEQEQEQGSGSEQGGGRACSEQGGGRACCACRFAADGAPVPEGLLPRRCHCVRSLLPRSCMPDAFMAQVRARGARKEGKRTRKGKWEGKRGGQEGGRRKGSGARAAVADACTGAAPHAMRTAE